MRAIALSAYYFSDASSTSIVGGLVSKYLIAIKRHTAAIVSRRDHLLFATTDDNRDHYF